MSPLSPKERSATSSKHIDLMAIISWLLLAFAAISGCGGGGGGGGGPIPPPPTQNPKPAISGLSPSSVVVGSPSQTLTINGSNFLADSAVTYNNSNHPIMFVNGTQLTITLSGGDQAAVGAFPVVVTNPAPGGGRSNSVNFTVNNPVPVISSLSPSSVQAEAAPQTLTINGSSFVSSSTVAYNGVGHPATFLSSTQLTISLGVGDLAAAGVFPVVVANPSPGGGPSNSVNFTVNNPVPTISLLSPNSLAAGGTAQTLTINGSSFVSSSTVAYNGVAHPAAFLSSTQLTISLSAGDLAAAGIFPVVVTDPAPGGGPSNSLNFTVNNPVPVISSLSPSSVQAGTAPQTLTINGSGFVSSSTVTYNSITHPVTFLSSLQLTISLNANDLSTPGAYPVVVSNPPPSGGSSNAVSLLVTVISDLAYQTLTARTTANQKSLFVYQDQDSAFNHAFPSGVFPSGAVLTIDAGCVDNPVDVTTGCYLPTDTSHLDTARGTVLRITFPALPGTNFAGLNIEEPENWGVLIANSQCDATVTCNAYDLSGAATVAFDVRSPTGINVQFGVGQCQAPFVNLPASQTYTHMSLNTSALSCAPVLNSVNVLFTATASNVPSGATVLLDNIQFTPVPSRANQGQGILSLPLSTQTFGAVPQTSSFPPDQVNRNVAAIYESALTILALLHRGQPSDITNALEIANALEYALYHDNHGQFVSVTPGASNGCFGGTSATSCGLHNAYEGGDIALLNDQNGSAGAGKAGDVRLGGFTCGSASASGFCLELDGSSGGNNAWAILALVAAYQQSGNSRYLNDAIAIGNWIVANLLDQTGTGFGGYYVGYPDQGVPSPKPLILGKSVENNADIFAAFTTLAAVESQLGNQNAATSWTNAANGAGDFVMQMYDPTLGRFNVGTLPANALPPPTPQWGTAQIRSTRRGMMS